MSSTFDLDRKHVFHSWSKQSTLIPKVINKAEGCYLYDESGKKIFDLSAQLLCVHAGHGQKEILDGIKAQMDKLTYVAPGFANDARSECAAAIARVTPGSLSKVLFTNGGADAIENAVKTAKLLTGRSKVITRYRSYHGATYGAMSLSGDPRHNINQGPIPGVVHVLDPHCYRCPFKLTLPECETHCADHVEEVIKYEGPENIAAILMEPITGTNGIIIPPPDYGRKIREICDKYGIILIVDEVMTGFIRTGKWFGVEHWGVDPDIMVLAKGLTSGYLPLGAMVVSEEIAKELDQRVLPLGLTYSGHPMSCAAGVATINFYEKHNILEHVQGLEERFLGHLEKLKVKHPCIGDVRGCGLFGVIEMVKDRKTREELIPWNAQGDEGKRSKELAGELYRNGVFTFVRWNWIFLSPPLIVTADELDDVFERLDKSLNLADSWL
jgi:taurine---2-oxoglutarate transaminase